jgi:hypothetical protein
VNLPQLVDIQTVAHDGGLHRLGEDAGALRVRRFLEETRLFVTRHGIILSVVGEQHQVLLQHRRRRVGARRHHPVQVGPHGRGIAFVKRVPLEHLGLGVEEANRVVVVDTELVGDDEALAQHTLARLDVVRIDVGQGLEDGECDQDLAHAARVLALSVVPHRVAGVVAIRKVEQRDAVAIPVLTEQALDGLGQRRIRLRQRQVPAIQQPQVHLRERQKLPGRTLATRQPAFLHPALMHQPRDAGELVPVQGIDVPDRGEQHEESAGGAAHGGTKET